MFDFLEEFNARQVIPAGYNAIQFIRQWARACAANGQHASFEALPPQQIDLAKRIIAEIETREAQSVVTIPLIKVDEYIKIIARKLQDLSRRDLHADPVRGKVLLEEMRLMR